MFEESLVESTALLQNRSRWPALLSFSAQAVVAATFVAVPMLHPELLPMHAPVLSLTPPPHPPAPPPPVPRVHVTLAATDAPSAPSAPAARASLLNTLRPAPSSGADPVLSDSVGPRMPGSPTLFPLLGAGETPHVTAAPAAVPAHTGPIALSGGVTAGLLLVPIRPDYPAIAKAAHVEGTVVVRAVISRAGQIERAQVVTGSPLLASAALQAVEQARYRPYLLNGQPTEVDTTVTVVFRLGS